MSDAEVEVIAPGPTRAELLKTAVEGALKMYVSFVNYDGDDVQKLSHKICDHKVSLLPTQQSRKHMIHYDFQKEQETSGF